jgi:hypothetical protein
MCRTSINQEVLLLSFVQTLHVSVVLQVRTGYLRSISVTTVVVDWPTLSARVVARSVSLSILVSSLVAVERTRSVDTVLTVGPVAIGNTLLGTLMIVVLVFVASLDQVLFSFLDTKGTYKSVAIARDIDVGHVATSISRSPVVAVATYLASHSRQHCLALPAIIVAFINRPVPLFVSIWR